MKRRNFIKILTAAGLTAGLPLSINKASADTFSGKFLVCLNLTGGWDPTSLCDPKGFKTDNSGNMINGPFIAKTTANKGNINRVQVDGNKRFGDIQWTAIPDLADDNAEERLKIEQRYDDFFNTYGDRLIAINGINTQTNNHQIGKRHTWSGVKDSGYPCMSALYAAAVAPTLPLSFIHHGGYDYTADLIPLSRASDSIYISNDLANVNFYSTSDNADKGIYFKSDDGASNEYGEITQAMASRNARQLNKIENPSFRKQVDKLLSFEGGDESLVLFGKNLKAIQDAHGKSRSGSLANQANVTAAAFASGVTVTATMNTVGFDTHNSHDQSHYIKVAGALSGVDYLNKALEFFGIADRTLVMVASDMGRAPWFNDGDGKDHWSISSTLILTPEGTSTGGRSFGATDDLFDAVKIDPNTGLKNDNGIELTPAHVTKAIYKYLGVEDYATSVGFNFDVADINLFG